MYSALYRLASSANGTTTFNHLKKITKPFDLELKLIFVRTFYTSERLQSDSRSSKMELAAVVNELNFLAPLKFAPSWDNVGLLVQPTPPFDVKRILLTNDLTEPVIEEAVKKEISLILSYHPPIFKLLSRVTQSNWKERVVVKCLENRIALYSPHTCYDALRGGVNDWLISPFCADSSAVEKVTPHSYSTAGGHRLDLTVPTSDVEKVKAEMKIPGVDLVAELSTVVDKGHMDESRLIFNCSNSSLDQAVKIVNEQKATKVELLQLSKMPDTENGFGRRGKLDQPISVGEAVQRVKSHLKLTHLRLALAVGATLDSPIETVAVCAGSGASILRGVKADLFVTGEMSHHEVLDANHAGTTVILCEHSNTEQGFIREKLVGMLQEKLKKVEILVSECDRDPLEVV